MTNTLAVISQSGESLSFFDVPSGTRTGRVTDLIAEPHELCFDARSSLLYVSHAYAHGWYPAHGDFGRYISVVDCHARRVVDQLDISPFRGPHYLYLDAPRDVMYVSVEHGLDDGAGGGIIGISVKSHEIVKSIASGHKSHWFVVTPDGGKAYTCNKEAGFISVIDLVGEKMTGTIEVPGGTEQPGMSRDGSLAYFPTPTIAGVMAGDLTHYAVKVIDTKSDTIVKSIPLDHAALTVHVDSQDRLLVGLYRFHRAPGQAMPTALNGHLKILASAAGDHRELGTVEVGPAPLTVFASPDGARAFASNIFAGTVSVVDMKSMAVERVLEVDTVKRSDKRMHQGAHGLALVP